jgi:hypothetical protein
MADEAALKEAHRALDDAIRRVVEISGGDNGIVVEWIACVATQRIDDDGTSLTLTDFIVDPDNNAPHYRLLGLVDYVHALLRKNALEEDE